MSRTLPLTVLVHEGPQARAYLVRMRQAGWKPSRILLMVESHRPGTDKAIGRWLPSPLRLGYAQKSQEVSRNFWPRRLRTSYPYLVESMAAEMSKIASDAQATIEEMLGPFCYEGYAERVERLLVRDLKDPRLREALEGLAPGAVLFTGGGIVPKSLLAVEGLRFLHVHPGYLPHVRGADGFLWSTLVRGRPGTACFYMAPGIDTGEVVATREYPRLTFDLGEHPRPPAEMLYRAIFSFCDPLLRAQFLMDEVLTKTEDLSALPAAPQDSNVGLTYHFLAPGLRDRALELVFRNGRRQGRA